MTFWLPDLMYIHAGPTIPTRVRGLALYRSVIDEYTRDDGDTEFTGRADFPAHEGSDHPDMSMWVVASNRLPANTNPRTGMLRVLAPSGREFVDRLETLRETCILVIDVYWPVDTMEEMYSLEADPDLVMLDEELTRDHWRPGGEAHTQLTRALRLAHAVTCPDSNPLTISDARKYSDHVWVVPDLNGERDEDIEAFGDALAPVAPDAAEQFARQREGLG